MLLAGDQDEVELKVPPHPGHQQAASSTSSWSPAGSIVGASYHKL
jgi:hypothetical protein